MWRAPCDRSRGPDSRPTRCFTTSYARSCLRLGLRARCASKISRTTTDLVVRRVRDVAVRRASSSGDTLHVMVGTRAAYYHMRQFAILLRHGCTGVVGKSGEGRRDRWLRFVSRQADGRELMPGAHPRSHVSWSRLFEGYCCLRESAAITCATPVAVAVASVLRSAELARGTLRRRDPSIDRSLACWPQSPWDRSPTRKPPRNPPEPDAATPPKTRHRRLP